MILPMNGLRLPVSFRSSQRLNILPNHCFPVSFSLSSRLRFVHHSRSGLPFIGQLPLHCRHFAFSSSQGQFDSESNPSSSAVSMRLQRLLSELRRLSPPPDPGTDNETVANLASAYRSLGRALAQLSVDELDQQPHLWLFFGEFYFMGFIPQSRLMLQFDREQRAVQCWERGAALGIPGCFHHWSFSRIVGIPFKQPEILNVLLLQDMASELYQIHFQPFLDSPSRDRPFSGTVLTRASLWFKRYRRFAEPDLEELGKGWNDADLRADTQALIDDFFPDIEDQVKAKDTSAMASAAHLLYHAIGVPENRSLACQLWIESFQLGRQYSIAEMFIAYKHRMRIQIQTSPSDQSTEAITVFEWLHKAVASYPIDLYYWQLSECYRYGIGTEPNIQLAAKYCHLAASDGQTLPALIYSYGKQLESDLLLSHHIRMDRAIEYYYVGAQYSSEFEQECREQVKSYRQTHGRTFILADTLSVSQHMSEDSNSVNHQVSEVFRLIPIEIDILRAMEAKVQSIDSSTESIPRRWRLDELLSVLHRPQTDRLIVQSVLEWLEMKQLIGVERSIINHRPQQQQYPHQISFVSLYHSMFNSIICK